MSKFLVPALVATGGLFALSLLPEFIEWSSFTAATLKASIGLGALVIADRFLLPNADTLEELKAGNVAWSVGFLGICSIIAAALLAS